MAKKEESVTRTPEQLKELVTSLETAAPTKSKTVKMVRHDDCAGPRTADVHPDEVDNWLKAGWHKE